MFVFGIGAGISFSISMIKEIYSQIFKVGIPMFVMQLLTSISLALINTAASNYGDSAVAAMGIVTRIFVLVSYVRLLKFL